MQQTKQLFICVLIKVSKCGWKISGFKRFTVWRHVKWNPNLICTVLIIKLHKLLGRHNKLVFCFVTLYKIWFFIIKLFISPFIVLWYNIAIKQVELCCAKLRVISLCLVKCINIHKIKCREGLKNQAGWNWDLWSNLGLTPTDVENTNRWVFYGKQT